MNPHWKRRKFTLSSDFRQIFQQKIDQTEKKIKEKKTFKILNFTQNVLKESFD